MKKIVSFLIVFIMVFGFCACGDSEPSDDNNGSEFGIVNADGTEVMNTLKDEYGIELDADPVDPAIDEGVDQLDYFTDGEDNWYEIDVEKASNLIICGDFMTNTKDFDYLKRCIELIAPNKDNVDRVKEWIDDTVNDEMSFEELDDISYEEFECDNVAYTLDATSFDFQNEEPYARVILSIWSVPYRDNVRSNH